MHARLRAETRALHARVERACPFGPALDRAAYVRHLALRLGFQVELERALDRWDRETVGIPRARDGAALLRRDLQELGWPSADLATTPASTDLPDLSSLARALGAAYVIEGARIGGRTIAPAVSRALGLGGRGVAFLSGGAAGASVARSFAVTLAAIDRHAAGLDDAGRGEIVAGARDTFASLARWLERGGRR